MELTAASDIMSGRLSIINENPQFLPGPQLLHKLLRWQGLDDICALHYAGLEDQRRSYTYPQLRSCVLSLAARLQEMLDAQPPHLKSQEQPIIPVFISQSPALYIAILAILEVGAAFCPVNLDAPRERIKFIVGDVAASIILSTRENEEQVSWENGPSVICIDDCPEPELESGLGENQDPRLQTLVRRDVQPHELAYVMYTSGSTGTPKGVGVSHLAVSQSLLAHEKFIPPFSRFLQFAAPSFDVSVFEIFFPLCRGATLVSCHRGKMLNDLVGMINELNIDAAELTPTVVGSLVQYRSNVPGLKLLLTIGEMLTRPVVDEFGGEDGERGRSGILYGMYGPTEAAIHCTVNSSMKAGARVGNIGIPFDTVSTFIGAPIEDKSSTEVHLLPLGEVGELILGGPQLARGYLNRPEQNTASFIPFRGTTVYRTGDKARLLSDGTIEVLGRISAGQVKLRGQRVELGEIEEVIYKHPGIKSVVASVLNGVLVIFATRSKDTNRGSKTADEDAESESEQIMATCAKWLPKFMLPSAIIILDGFPYLSSGKVDRKKLAADFERSHLEQAVDESPSQSVSEIEISAILKKILGVLVIAVSKRLSQYGLDSLMAIRVAAALRAKGYTISPVEVLKAESLQLLASRCDELRAVQNGNTSGGEKPNKTELKFDFTPLQGAATAVLHHEGITNSFSDVLPCTPLQDAMLAETARDEIAYGNTIQLLVKNQGLEDVRRAFGLLVGLHPLLRTGFVDCDSVWSAFSMVVWDEMVEGMWDEGSTFDLNIDGNSTIETKRPAKPSIVYPLHIQAQIHDTDITLTLKIHHAIYDAWSFELLLDDFETILSGKSPIPRPEFKEVVLYHLRSATNETLWPSKQYWKDHLTQLSPSPLPNFHPTTNEPRGLHVREYNTKISTAALVTASRKLHSSPQAVFQAAYALLLRSLFDKADICFGTVFSGRTTAAVPGIEDIAGPCLATLPVRVDIDTVRTVGELIQLLNATNRRHIEHDSLSLREIQKAAVAGDISADAGSALFDSLLIWQQTLHTTGQTRKHVDLLSSTDFLEFNFTLEITPTEETILLKANYQTALFPVAQIDLLLRQLEQFVLAFVKNPELAIGGVNACLGDELLAMENLRPVDEELPLHLRSMAAAVEDWAKREPERGALAFAWDITATSPTSSASTSISSSPSSDAITDTNTTTTIETLTYSALNLRANRIAHHLLRTYTIQPDELVCICMRKSPLLYISILAVCKTGAGYVPITPDTPPERIRNIVKMARVKVVVVDEEMREVLSGEVVGEKTLMQHFQEDGVQIVVVSELERKRDDRSKNIVNGTDYVNNGNDNEVNEGYNDNEERYNDDENPPQRSTLKNLAYCIFTSGSTGTPKGVLVEQGALLANLQVLGDLYPGVTTRSTSSSNSSSNIVSSSSQPHLLQSCSQAFDVSVFEIFYTFSIGGLLCSAAPDVLFRDIELSCRVLGITHLSLTPTVAALIRPEKVPQVGFLVTAGEGVTEKVFALWADNGLWQGYGPSETTNICSVRKQVSKHMGRRNLGPCFVNTAVYVLEPASSSSSPDDSSNGDENSKGLSPVPRGAIGEFCFGGSQLARGYLNPAQDLGKFIQHPVYGRLYRSGDFGRLLTDGSLVFEGRRDGQVKVRGMRVELGEVDKGVLAEDVLVKDAVTVIVKSDTGREEVGNEQTEKLVTFWVSSSSSVMTTESPSFQILNSPTDAAIVKQLYNALAQSLPSYMLPSALIHISHVPATTQGKVDRRLLLREYAKLSVKELEAVSRYGPSASSGLNGYSAAVDGISSNSSANTPLEKAIIAASSAVTSVPEEEIHPHSSFLGLGIDSITAIRLCRVLREEFGIDVLISDVLRCAVVARLAAEVQRRGENGVVVENGKNGKRVGEEEGFNDGFDGFEESIGREFEERWMKGKYHQHWEHPIIHSISPCTPLQESMLSAAETQSSSSSHLYNNHVLLNLHVSIAAFENAWRVMVQRHEILRTCFVRNQGRGWAFAQVVLEDWGREQGHEVCKVLEIEELEVPIEELVSLVERREESNGVGGKCDLEVERGEIGGEEDDIKPLWGVTYFKRKQGEESGKGRGVKVLLSMHHALYDGFAMGILYAEIEKVVLHGEGDLSNKEQKLVSNEEETALPNGKVGEMPNGKEIPMPNGEQKKLSNGDLEILPPPVSFQPFLEYMVKGQGTAADGYWDGLLKGYMPRGFGTQKEKTATKHEKENDSGSFITSKTSSLLLTTIENFTKSHNISLLALLQSIWSSVLSSSLLSADICFGSVVSGRSIPVANLDRLVAPCFNTIPVRVQDLHQPSASFLDVFRILQAQHAASLPFQLSALRRIQARAGLDGSRLFDSLLILQPVLKRLDDRVWQLHGEMGGMDVPLVIEIVPHSGGGLQLLLHVQRGVLTEEEAELLLALFNARLMRAVENPRNHLLEADVRVEVARNVEEMRERQEREDGKDKNDDDGNDKLNIEAMSTIELRIRDIIATFTTVPLLKIRRNTSIYRLGLDSISAVQVAAALRKEKYNVLASDVLQHPSIAQLGAYLLSHISTAVLPAACAFDFSTFHHAQEDAVRSTLGIPPYEPFPAKIRPCTPVQCGMLAQSLLSGGSQYVNSFEMQLLPAVDLARVKSAWEAVSAEHEMLRTVFLEGGTSGFLMVVWDRNVREVPWYDNAEKSEDFLLKPWKLEVMQRQEGNNVIKFTAHHALYDARSLELLLDDVVRWYSTEAIMAHGPVDSLLGAILEASDVDGSFDEESNKIVNGNTNNVKENKKKTFWQTENKIFINRFPDLTPLRESSTKIRTAEKTLGLSSVQLEALCRQHNASIQAVGQAAWARLLSAYVGESMVTFGVTLSGRSILEDAENTAFPSLVTLPVSCQVTGSNGDLLERTMKSNARLHEHQFTPLTLIQKWSGYPEGRMFDTLFAYQKTATTEKKMQPLWKVVNEESAADFVVSLELQHNEDGEMMPARLTFQENLVPVEHAQLILEQFDLLFQDILLNSSGTCGHLEFADSGLLSVTPALEPILPSDVQLLHDFVVSQAQKTPTKIALEFSTSMDSNGNPTQSWTYEQLEQEGNRIADFLLKNGTPQGSLVAICFDKCPEASFALLGILQAGCAYLALDPNAPADRVKFIMDDSKTNMIFTSGKPAQALLEAFDADNEVRIVDLGDIDVLRDCSIHAPVLSRPVDPQDTSYCLYTSGTTGTPKGCEITHENAVQAMLAFQHLFAGHWTPESKWLQFASFHFDVSVLEQFWSWSVGICVATAPRDLIFEDIPGAIRHMGITHIDLTPSLARLLDPDDVPNLCKGVFITGGEQLKQEILDVWGEKGCIYNGYGPTEVTIGCTMYPRVPRNGKPANIGPQFLNVGSYVLQPGSSNPVLRGAVGELCVSGKLVGKGYLNRPELTTERFPYLKDLGERIYRTGDLVRILHNGDFLFLGRADDQVKLRGQRLELTEINEVIKKNAEGVQEVVTLVLKHAMQQKEQLVTFFVSLASSDQVPDIIARIRDACRARLPGYMVPTHFIPLERLPLSANNKADSKQLALLYNNLSIADLQSLSTSSAEGEKWTPAEERVVTALAEALSLAPSALTRSTNIFELGVDSISVIGLARTLQRAGFGAAKLTVVMQNSAIDSLVKILAAGAEQGVTEQHRSYIAATQNIAAFAHRNMVELDVEAEAVEVLAPCTPAQEGMIYRFLDSEDALYFSSFEFELDAQVDLQRLRAAWEKVVARLQVLRTKFVLTSDGCAQVVFKERPLPWQVVDVNNSPAGDFDKEIQDQREVYKKMDKADSLADPYKISVLQSSYRRALCLNIFHGIYDGFSLPLILQKVLEEYRNVQDVDYGALFHDVLPYGPLAVLEGVECFWKDTLAKADYWPLQRVLVENGAAEVIKTSGLESISATKVLYDVEHLDVLCKQLGVTHQAILQAAWYVTLQNHISHATTVGVVISGRSIDFEGTERVIGPMLNTVPFYINMASGITWEELIKACHVFNTAVLPYQHSSLKDVQKWCANGGPLFDTLFVFQHEAQVDTETETLWKSVPSKPVADYPLAFEAELNNDGKLALTLVGQRVYILEETASTLLSSVEDALLALRSPETLVPRTMILSNGYANSQSSSPVQPESEAEDISGEFEWSPNAKQIQLEISSLAGIATDSISEHTSLFSIGLDSIDVIKLASRLKKLGLQISVSAIVKSQTIAKMVLQVTSTDAAHLTTKTSLREHEERLKNYLVEAGRWEPETVFVLPATPLQEGMVAEMVRSGYERYFNHELFHVSDGVDMEKLKRAWEDVVAAFDILRTSFVEIDDVNVEGSFAQVVCASERDLWLSRKLEGDSELEAETAEIIVGAIQGASRGKLLQLTELKAGEDQYYVLSISHALYDGWSLQALHEDVWKAYHGKDIRRPDPRPTLEDVLDTDRPEATKFWRTSLSGVTRSEFPSTTSQDIDLVHQAERPSKHSLSSIENFCRIANISLQTLGQTVWALLLASYLKRLDIVFGVVLSCRDTEEASEIMFPLMNTVAVRSVLHGSLAEMLRYMQDNSNSMRPYQHFPLRKAQALSGFSGGNIFNSLFIYQGKSRQQAAGAERLYKSLSSKSEVEFAVCVEMELVAGGMIWRTACKDSAKSAEETTDLLDGLDTVLGRILEDSRVATIVSSAEGLSICGLPIFKDETMAPKLNGHALEPKKLSNDSNWTEAELTIRTILAQISGVTEDEINKDQTIFHLGLDSISAIKVSSILRRRGLRLSVNDIVKNNTIRSMSGMVRKLSEGVAELHVDSEKILGDATKTLHREELLKKAGIEDENVESMMPVTAGQLYMLARWHNSGGTMFFASFKYRMLATLDKEMLQAAWQSILKRHLILRTVFVMTDQEDLSVIQIVLKETKNLVQWCPSTKLEAGNSLLAPLALVITEDDSGFVLELRIHHALYDAISLPLILQDLQDLYLNPSINTPEQPRFVDFVANTLDSTSSIKEVRKQFWESYLPKTSIVPSGISANTLPSGKRIEIFHPSIPIQDISLIARRMGVGIDALILATFSRIYQALFAPAQNAITIGLYLANRAPYNEDLSALSAPTLNLLPLHVMHAESSVIQDLATSIQVDLQKLCARDVVGTSLKEIYSWTGTKVECFVNLIKISSAEEEDNTFLEPHVDVRRKRSEIIDCGLTNANLLPQTGDENLSAAYSSSIDFEMRVTEGGRGLDIGVFAPLELLDLRTAEQLVEQMGAALQELR